LFENENRKDRYIMQAGVGEGWGREKILEESSRSII
jgi:hypothetical protein